MSKKAPLPKRAASAQPDPMYDDRSESPDDPLLLARKPNGQIPYYPKTPNNAGAGRGFINPPIPNSIEQYKMERRVGDPNALRLSFEEWKKL